MKIAYFSNTLIICIIRTIFILKIFFFYLLLLTKQVVQMGHHNSVKRYHIPEVSKNQNSSLITISFTTRNKYCAETRRTIAIRESTFFFLFFRELIYTQTQPPLFMRQLLFLVN